MVDDSELAVHRALVEVTAQDSGEDFLRSRLYVISATQPMFLMAFIAEFTQDKTRVRA